MLIYLLRLLQDTLKKSFAVLIGYRPFWDVPQYLCLTGDTSSKPLFLWKMSAFFVFNDPFSDKRNLFYSNCLICLRQIPGLSWYTAFLFSLDFVLKGKGAIGQLIATFEAKFSTISLKLDDIFWYYIFIVKIDPEHYIYIFFAKEVTWPIHRPPCRDCSLNWRNWLDTEIYRIADWLGQSFGHQNK